MSKDAVSARSLEIARALLVREAARSTEGGPTTSGGTLQRLCSLVCENLCNSMGEGGCSALLTRALALVEGDHPALSDVRSLRDGRVQLDEVVGATAIHGLDAVATGVEALLAALIEVLSRLIGEDMTKTLMDWDSEWPDPVGETEAP